MVRVRHDKMALRVTISQKKQVPRRADETDQETVPRHVSHLCDVVCKSHFFWTGYECWEFVSFDVKGAVHKGYIYISIRWETRTKSGRMKLYISNQFKKETMGDSLNMIWIWYFIKAVCLTAVSLPHTVLRNWCVNLTTEASTRIVCLWFVRRHGFEALWVSQGEGLMVVSWYVFAIVHISNMKT